MKSNKTDSKDLSQRRGASPAWIERSNGGGMNQKIRVACKTFIELTPELSRESTSSFGRQRTPGSQAESHLQIEVASIVRCFQFVDAYAMKWDSGGGSGGLGVEATKEKARLVRDTREREEGAVDMIMNKSSSQTHSEIAAAEEDEIVAMQKAHAKSGAEVHTGLQRVLLVEMRRCKMLACGTKVSGIGGAGSTESGERRADGARCTKDGHIARLGQR
ncbi:hypothetical protein B0H19DRAFT_1085893 [Mycena capillaripes]|nr:hypothetical protein B0H19DRAFT_1085893 [Mycena capillaripes]